jgi:hypothetical protein
MVQGRRSRLTKPPTLNAGPVWLVTSSYSEEYVVAETAVEAIRVYYLAVEAKREADEKATEVREVRLVAGTVHAYPKTSGDGDGS